MALVDTLTRQKGELIRSADWNTLVAAIDDIRNDLTTAVSELKTKLTAVENQANATAAQVSDLSSQLGALTTRVNGFLKNYATLTLKTARAEYALGETVEISAKVTDLEGNAFTAGAQHRPFIDFMTTWGSFGEVSGYEARMGVGNRSISVRVDSSGMARVRLRPEHAQNLPGAIEAYVALYMASTPAGAAKPVSQMYMDAKTPDDAKPAYQAMTAAYQRKDNKSMQQYADSYYVWGSHAVAAAGGYTEVSAGYWKYYRALVMASVNADAEPTTPDQSRGLASIQISFRDWISTWVGSEFPQYVAPAENDIYDRFKGIIDTDYEKSAERTKKAVDEILDGKGLIERDLYYELMHNAFDRVNPPELEGKRLVNEMKESITMQSALERASKGRSPYTSEAVGFHALANVATSSGTEIHGIRQDVSRVTQQTNTLETTVRANGTDIAELKGTTGAYAETRQTMVGLEDQVNRVRDSFASYSAGFAGLRETVTAMQNESRDRGVQAENRFHAVEAQVKDAHELVAAANDNISKVRESMQSLGGRVDEALGAAGPLQFIKSQIDTVTGQVASMRGLDVSELQNKLSRLDARLNVVERGR